MANSNRLRATTEARLDTTPEPLEPQGTGIGVSAAGSSWIGDPWPSAGVLTRVGLLLLPALAPLLILFCGAMVVTFVESFKVYVPGRIIQPSGSFTIKNYTTFASLIYVSFFVRTIRIAALSTIISTILAYPVAYKIARSRSSKLRKFLITLSILTFFLSGMVRVVSLVIVLGNNGLVNSFLALLGSEKLWLVGTETGVVIGLVHFQLSVAILTLVGPITNIEPSLEEAAEGLGASKLRTFYAITLPLSMPGILAATMISFAVGVSAFTVPLFLGKGRVAMISNLIYDRFSDVLNFPEGSALAVILLCTCFFLTYVASALSRSIPGAPQ